MTKTQTKRKTLRQKYKIKRKVAEHNRQQKKAAKKAKTLGFKKSKVRKNTDIPNSYPFKKEVLNAIQIKKELEQVEKMEQRKARRAEKKRKRESDMGLGSVEELQRRVQMKQMEYESKSEMMAGDEDLQSLQAANDGSRKAYFREFRKVVDESDVILEVLDARDPMGCRCIEIEKFIMQRDPTKRIVLVMNKIDLVPKENIQDWLSALRKNLPTIAFKSSTQQQNSRIGRVNKDVNKLSESQLKLTQCIGADTLMKLLKNYTRNQNIKISITVGVIGYPNVGKSSLINSLKREKVVGVGATPGFTKVKQEIHLDKNIRLLDCPGIVFSSRETTETGIMLRSNAIKVQQIGDPAAAVELIVRQCQKEKLMVLYGISLFDTARDFLGLVAHKRGKMKRGGIPNYEEIARLVIQDWNQGKVPFYTIPPSTPTPSPFSSSSSSVMTDESVGAQIVSSWAKEFDIDALLGDDNSTLDAVSHPMEAEELSFGASSNFDDEMIDEMKDIDKKPSSQLAFGTVKKRKKADSDSGSMEVEGLSDSIVRKNKKKKKKTKMEVPEGLRDEGGNYDFSDFAAFAKLEGHQVEDDDEEEDTDEDLEGSDEDLEGSDDEGEEDDEEGEDDDEELVDME